MVKKSTIGKVQICVGIVVIILGILIAGFAYKYTSEGSNPMLVHIGENSMSVFESSDNFEGYTNESINQLIATFSTGAANEISNMNQLKFILLLSELIILAISLLLILQGLANISNE